MIQQQMEWTLDPRLAADSALAGELALCQFRIMNDANYPWLILVPRRPAASEWTDLPPKDRAVLTEEIARCADALKAITACDKINIAMLGNMVPQLHIHIIARRKTDAAWPKPVWGTVAVKPYNNDDLARLMSGLRSALQLDAP